MTYVNDRWYAYCGLTPEQNARGWPELVLHPDDLDRCVAQWSRALAEGREYEIEVRNRRHDGAYRWFVTRAVPRKDAAGRILSWFGITTDIHELKELQAALHDADRRKDEFLATLAHELRNPLAPIRNGLEVLRLAGDDPAAVLEARAMMTRQVSHLVRLIDDLMDVSRITRGKIELRRERMDLAAAVHSAVEISRPHVVSGRHELTVTLPDRPVRVLADPARLAQALANLLNNATKYTEPGGRIVLVAGVDGDQAVVRVRDTGVGIPADMLPRVFDLFVQVPSSLAHSQGGMGIGLTLVKRLVEMHGGAVESYSDGPGRGSEFVVRLPLLKPDDSGDEADPAAPTSSLLVHHPVKVLICDDNRDSADSLAILLRLAGHDVRVAYHGPGALESARSFRPGVVLQDIEMPGMSGYDVARRLRGHPALADVLLVAMTGYGSDEDRRRSAEAGFDHHLVKPVDLDELHRLLASVAHTSAR
jgi:PAS domain S-box-containing protein